MTEQSFRAAAASSTLHYPLEFAGVLEWMKKDESRLWDALTAVDCWIWIDAGGIGGGCHDRIGPRARAAKDRTGHHRRRQPDMERHYAVRCHRYRPPIRYAQRAVHSV